VKASGDHAGENKHVDLLSSSSSAHFDFKRSGKVQADVVKRLELLTKTTIWERSHRLSVDSCFEISAFGTLRLNLSTKCSHSVDGVFVSDRCIHGLNANWVLMLDMSSFDNESGVIRFSMKDDRVSFVISETRNVCESRSASENAGRIQKWIKFQDLARLVSSDFSHRSKVL